VAASKLNRQLAVSSAKIMFGIKACTELNQGHAIPIAFVADIVNYGQTLINNDRQEFKKK